MSNIKERIIGAITVLTDDDAEKIWYFLQENFPQKSWDNIEEIEATEEETQIISDYENGKDEYQPYMSHEDVLKEIGLK